jgi:hypothetical protein
VKIALPYGRQVRILRAAFQKDTMKNIAAIAVLAATRATSTQVGYKDK